MHTLLYIKQVTNKGLLYSTWNSAQCYVAAWMGGKFGGEWILVYVWLHPFAAQMELSQYCWFAIAQYNIKSSKKKKKIVHEEAAEGRDMGRDHRGITHQPQELSFFFREPTWGSEEEADLAPSLPWLSGKVRLCVDFTVLWVRPGITHQNASHQSCRT